MIKTAINIEPLYPGLEICEKIRKVSAAGFKAIEFWSWDDRDIKEIKKTCQECGVKISAFTGTKSYSLCDREHQRECIDWVEQSIVAAKELDCDKLILFPNHFTPDGCADYRDKYSPAAAIANITNVLTRMVPLLEKNDMTALLEPLCDIGNDAGMSVTDTAVGAAIMRLLIRKM